MLRPRDTERQRGEGETEILRPRDTERQRGEGETEKILRPRDTERRGRERQRDTETKRHRERGEGETERDTETKRHRETEGGERHRGGWNLLEELVGGHLTTGGGYMAGARGAPPTQMWLNSQREVAANPHLIGCSVLLSAGCSPLWSWLLSQP